MSNMTYGDLMEDKKYRKPVMKALEELDKEDKNRVNNIQQREEMPIYRSYVKIGKTDLQATWDSGAQKSMITESLTKLLNLKWDTDKRSKIKTINGAKNVTLGTLIQANLKVAGQLTPIDIQVIKSEDQELLIGANWLLKYKANLMLDDEKVTFKVDGKPIEIKLTATMNRRNQINMLQNPDDQWMQQPEDAWEWEETTQRITEDPIEISRWEEKCFTVMGRY